MSRIYLDHNATTPVHPAVLEAYAQATMQAWGNASSLHAEGRVARHVVETARKQVALLLGAKPEEVVFTSGGTESNQLGLWAACKRWEQAHPGVRGQIVSSKLEHPSVGNAVERLGKMGWPVRWVAVDGYGRLDVGDYRLALQEPTALVALALCNHEIGNLYPIAELTTYAHKQGAWVHCDAVQAVGRIPVEVTALGVDSLALSAHKMYGPKGIGALYLRGDMAWLQEMSLLLGGQQEKGRRAGTESVPLIAAFGVACQRAQQELDERVERITVLRDQLEEQLLAIAGATLHGDLVHRVPGTCNIGFAGVEGALVLMGLDLRGVAVSTGAACSSGTLAPSSVLLAMGYPRQAALQAVRFSVGMGNTPEQMDQVAAWTREIVTHIRSV